MRSAATASATKSHHAALIDVECLMEWISLTPMFFYAKVGPTDASRNLTSFGRLASEQEGFDEFSFAT